MQADVTSFHSHRSGKHLLRAEHFRFEAQIKKNVANTWKWSRLLKGSALSQYLSSFSLADIDKDWNVRLEGADEWNEALKSALSSPQWTQKSEFVKKHGKNTFLEFSTVIGFV